jgi:hypothetical protein
MLFQKLRKPLEREILHPRQVIMHLTEKAAGNLAQRLTFGNAAVTTLSMIGRMIGTGRITASANRLSRHNDRSFICV